MLEGLSLKPWLLRNAEAFHLLDLRGIFNGTFIHLHIHLCVSVHGCELAEILFTDYSMNIAS